MADRKVRRTFRRAAGVAGIAGCLWASACPGGAGRTPAPAPDAAALSTHRSAAHWVANTYRCEVPEGLVTHASAKAVRVKPDSHWTNLSPWAFWAVEQLRPDRLVELGSYTGYSYFAFVQAIAEAGLATQAYAVDAWAGDLHYGDNFGEGGATGDNSVYRGFTDYHDAHYAGLGFSHVWKMDFDAAAAQTPDGSVDLLHIDGAHDYASVAHDFATWLPKMSQRGVIMFHDIAVKHPSFGVKRLWSELSARYPHFTFSQWAGLGILGVGRDLPEPARQLFGLDARGRACLHMVYEDFGSRAMDLEVSEPPAGPQLP